jgi:hypothetical protein
MGHIYWFLEKLFFFPPLSISQGREEGKYNLKKAKHNRDIELA